MDHKLLEKSLISYDHEKQADGLFMVLMKITLADIDEHHISNSVI